MTNFKKLLEKNRTACYDVLSADFCFARALKNYSLRRSLILKPLATMDAWGLLIFK